MTATCSDEPSTFVMAQLRPEISRLGRRARVHHLRTKAGREEIDIVIELPGGKLIGLEIIELGNRIHALPISSFWG